MKSLFAVACLLLISSLPSSGQGRRVGTASRPRLSAPDMSPNTTIYLSGTVVVDDGSVLTESAVIQTVCRGQKRTETHTDSHGSFAFQFGSRPSLTSSIDFDADTPSRSSPAGRTERRDVKDCELQASLAGFTSDVVQLGGRFSGYDNADVGRIVLHRIGGVAGFTISATTAEAPDPARKALQKGQEQSKKSHWDDAQKLLEKAVAIFPRMAVAWFELGRVQLHKNDVAGARNSFNQSIAADSKYINPYHGLTQIAQHDRNWQELTSVSEKLLALDPVSFPDVWLLNAVGHYSLQDLAAAEKSARRGLHADADHHVPKLEYMLGLVLMHKPDYAEAALHFRAFQHFSDKPADNAEAQKQLEEIARLSASSPLAASERK